MFVFLSLEIYLVTMKKKTFTLPADISQGSELALNNAGNLFGVAELAAKSAQYGVATSLLILSAEEAIKAGMLLIKQCDPSLGLDDIGDYFSKHPVKHRMIASIEIWHSFFDIMLNARLEPIIALSSKVKLPSKKELKEARDQGVQNLIVALEQLASGASELYSNQAWWNGANIQKNQGLYVNIVGQNWEAPGSITKNDYLKAKKIVAEFKEKVGCLKRAIVDPEYLAIYSELRLEFEESTRGEKK